MRCNLQAPGLVLTFFEDAKSGPLDFGRADALNARTQQYFEVAGLLDELLSQGLKCNSKRKKTFNIPPTSTENIQLTFDPS